MEQETIPAPTPALTSTEFAALLGVSRKTFIKWRKTGLFEGLQSPIPRRWSRFKVEEWLKNGVIPGQRGRSRVA